MQRLNRSTFQNMSPAQRAVINPIRFDSVKATVISLSKAGLYENALSIPTFKLMVETSEQPGQPLELRGQASIAAPLSRLKVGDSIAFDGTIQGSIGRGKRPHVVVNHFEVL